eukprot:1766701-Amphidinium_carterae.1
MLFTSSTQAETSLEVHVQDKMDAEAPTVPGLGRKALPMKFFGDGNAVLQHQQSWGRSTHAFTVQPMLSESHARLSTVLLAWCSKGKARELSSKFGMASEGLTCRSAAKT